MNYVRSSHSPHLCALCLQFALTSSLCTMFAVRTHLIFVHYVCSSHSPHLCALCLQFALTSSLCTMFAVRTHLIFVHYLCSSHSPHLCALCLQFALTFSNSRTLTKSQTPLMLPQYFLIFPHLRGLIRFTKLRSRFNHLTRFITI